MSGETRSTEETKNGLTAMRETFAALGRHLTEAADGRQIVYLPNPGNYGDGLIRYGTKQLFSDLGIAHYELNLGYSRIKYQLFPLLLKRDRYHFVYGGGGAWSNAYGFGQSTVELIARFTDRYTALPSTFGKPVSLTNGTIFRRDKAESVVNAPTAEFCHDMAFYAAARAGAHAYVWPEPTKRIGIMMRTDHESRFSSDMLDEANEDISLEGDHMSIGPDFLMRVADY